MKHARSGLGASIALSIELLVVLLAASSPAAVRYVDLNSPGSASPYLSWSTAATSIQDAIDAASAGDQILVTNGVYEIGGGLIPINSSSNRVAVSKALDVRSLNGPTVTVIKGYRAPGGTNDSASMRCVGLVDGSSLTGFTLTNGCCNQSGGGVFGTPLAAISNCIIVGSSARINGGGGNTAIFEGCVFSGNTAGVGGGGASGSVVDNCLVISNWAGFNGGGLGGGTAKNCTVVGNFTTSFGAGVTGGQVWNSIFYYNTVSTPLANGTNTSGSILNHCCTIPVPAGPSGAQNFTNAPAFANPNAGDFRLSAISPCVNTGTNDYVGNPTDLAGLPRIQMGIVDVGAYEFQAPIHYVSIASVSPTTPFGNWTTAATNIQDAVDAAAPGEFVVVSNGLYNVGGRVVAGSQTNRLVITNSVTVIGWNGAAGTTIAGGSSTRCALVGSNSVLVGFTLTNGQTRIGGDVAREQSGGGIWCEPGGVVSNCVVMGNHTGIATGTGGGIYGGAIWNSTLTNNFAGFGGAAAQCVLNNCLVLSNSAPYSPQSGLGGGLYQCAATNCTIAANGWGYGTTGGGAFGSRLHGCTLYTNHSDYGAGGAENSLLINCLVLQNRGMTGGTDSCTNYNCTLLNNLGISGGGMAGGYAWNSLLFSNIATFSGGAADKGTLYNCTVVGNASSNFAGGLNGATAYNCIVYYNTASSGSNWSGATMYSCCTMPLTGGSIFQSISNAPLFVNGIAGNLRLQSNSPCINSGTNFFAAGASDLDGNARIVGGTVDIGAYEFQSPVSTLPYYWLTRYGLPIDASSDSADPDADGASNLQEWGAGTVPTNALSVLKLLSPTQAVSGITVTWQSVFGRKYWIERSTNLGALPAFQLLQSNITASGSTTTYTDSNAVGVGPYFYRVGAQ